MRLLGFPRKLRLAPFWPALAAVLTASLLLWQLLPGLFERGASAQLLDTLQILTRLVSQRLTASGEDVDGPVAADLEAWVRDITAESDLRITLIRADGHVIADSSRTVEQVPGMENHAGRPELQEALRRGQGVAVRRSETTGLTYVYAARTLTVPRAGGAPGESGLLVLRLAQPLAQVEALRGGLAAAMGLAAAAAGLVIFVVSWWIGRRLFDPLARLIVGAGDLASGRKEQVEVPDEEELAPLARALNHLAETAAAQFAAVRQERDHLMAILASMSEGVLVVDGEGRALLVNPAFRRLFDLAGEVTGRPVLEIVRLPELARVVADTLRLGEGQGGQVELAAPEKRTLLLASAALSGGGRGAVVVARDTTELTRLGDMRRDFVANVSHELKTPLAAIRGYAETLRDGALDEPPIARRFTERILWQCRRLQALLDDLLTLSRLESVTIPREREPVDLHAVVRRMAELLSAAAREKQVRIEVEEKPVPPVLGDADGIERMLSNLLDNAIKYNRPDGRVTVR
ncbi:MAG TPA: histidine kinase dimerization/phospho-acceptor domain-containing protein, partial [Thermoanaerobaculia bacterium]|nr:histidine kinase dimerization/phospho-acceptor domain-containing protein [Thermoanaerobaculia bacterium]